MTPRPRYAVWEITLACDLSCAHCGSRAGRRRPDELTTEEALRVVDELAGLGVEECSLIGGEAYLREDWDHILRALRDRRIRPSVVTGGRGLTRGRVRRAKDAGVETISVSIDGLEETHDILRGWKGSWLAAIDALDNLRAEGVRHTTNTQVNRLNIGELDALCDLLLAKGIKAWQVQITAALGRAADWPEMLLQPPDVLHLVPRVAELKKRCATAGCELLPGNSIGYYGPFESQIRTAGGIPTHWQGCGACSSAIGIESDGTFKGCPSLQTKDYAAGNLRERTAGEIWNESPVLLKFRERTRADLWGFCGTCHYADVCRAGCTFTAHALFGRPGNMPYCWHRADALRERGVQETLVPVERAPGLPFDNGRFELHEEPIESQSPWEEIRAEIIRTRALSRVQAPRLLVR